FEKELLDQERLATDEPYLAEEALLESLTSDGLDRPSAYRVVKTLAQRQDLLLRTVQEKVLGLGSADLSNPVKAAAGMYLSFVLGCVVPLVPYALASPSSALLISWLLSVAALLGVGVFKGAVTGKPLLVSGLEFAAVALSAALVGWLVGRLFISLGALSGA